MKKIINGKMYDTETAKEIGCYNNGLGVGDFRHLSETLYCKKTGEFFLYGTGGAMTRYAKEVSDGITGGEEIIPFSEREAKEWCEQHLDADTYAMVWGEVEE